MKDARDRHGLTELERAMMFCVLHGESDRGGGWGDGNYGNIPQNDDELGACLELWRRRLFAVLPDIEVGWVEESRARESWARAGRPLTRKDVHRGNGYAENGVTVVQNGFTLTKRGRAILACEMMGRLSCRHRAGETVARRLARPPYMGPCAVGLPPQSGTGDDEQKTGDPS